VPRLHPPATATLPLADIIRAGLYKAEGVIPYVDSAPGSALLALPIHFGQVLCPKGKLFKKGTARYVWELILNLQIKIFKNAQYSPQICIYYYM
jgi:hypothetical protein